MEELRWKKSTRSNGQGGDCVECAELPEGVAVRDSKDPKGPMLRFNRAEWSAFMEWVKEL